jgi:hypothetical protein
MRVRRVLVAAVLVVAVLTTGASACRPQPPAGVSATATAAAEPGPTEINDLERRAAVPVPAGMAPHTLEFADVDHGYALYQRCDPDPSASPDTAGAAAANCSAAMVATLDGGQSWVARTLPVTRSRGFQLYVVDARTVLVAAAPDRWYVSHDSGRTFTPSPIGVRPPEYDLLGGPLEVACPSGAGDCARPSVLRVTPTARVPLASQPALPGTLVAARQGADGRVWAVSLQGDVAYPALSRDQGRSWLRGAPLGPGGGRRIERALLLVSADGADAWVVLVTAAGFPALWWWDQPAGRWRSGEVAGHPEPASAAGVAVAPAGAGVLAMVVNGRLGYVLDGGARWSWERTVRLASSVRALADGTLAVPTSVGLELWLGIGTGQARQWRHVLLVS